MKFENRLQTIKPVFSFLLRSTAAYFCTAAFLFFFVFSRWRRYDHDRYIKILSQLDLFRILFYGLGLSAVFITLVFFVVGSNLIPRIYRRSNFFLLLCLSAVAAAIPYGLLRSQYGPVPLPAGWPIPCLFLAWNSFALLFWGAHKKWDESSVRPAFRFAVASDLIAPLFIWSCYRKKFGALLVPFVILPWTFIGALQFMPWALDPVPLTVVGTKPAPWLKQILPHQDFYQVALLPDDNSLLVSSFPNLIRRIDPETGLVTAEASAEPFSEHLQGFGFDPDFDEIAWVDAGVGRTMFLSKRDLRITRTASIADPLFIEEKNRGVFASRTLWNPGAGILLSYNFTTHATQLSPEGDRIVQDLTAFPEYRHTSDGVIEAGGRVVHWVSWKGRLLEWDAVGHKPLRSYQCASTPDRIALDETGGRLFLPLPMIGKVEVVETKTYRRTALIDSFLGVRVPMPSQETRRLYLAGLSPILEIRSFDDFSLIDRVFAPPWMRWIAVDGARQKAYLTGIGGGLTVVDLAYLDSDAMGSAIRRLDLFYPLVTRLARLLNALAPLPEVFIPSVREENRL